MKRVLLALCVSAMIVLAMGVATPIQLSARSYGVAIVVVNPFNATWRLVVEYRCSTQLCEFSASSSSPSYVHTIGPGSSYRIEFSYWLPKGPNSTYIVVPMGSPIVYLLTFPRYLGAVRGTVLRSYSWLDYPWRSAPWGLEIMAGTEGCYVEESVAGRIFNLFYEVPYRYVKDVLDEMGIEDERARIEIAATALWATQLVREVKEGGVDPYLCIVAGSAILDKYFGFPKWGAHALSVLIVPMCYYVKLFVDKEVLYKAILYAIKSVRKYVEVFPEWRKVSEGKWVEMCERLEGLTVKPAIPTYAHLLVAGAYALYEAHLLAKSLEEALIEIATGFPMPMLRG